MTTTPAKPHAVINFDSITFITAYYLFQKKYEWIFLIKKVDRRKMVEEVAAIQAKVDDGKFDVGDDLI